MLPNSIASTPPPVQMRSAELATTPRGPMQAQFDGATNAAEAPKPSRSVVANLTQGLRGLFSATNPGRKPEITIVEVQRNVVASLAQTDDAEVVGAAFDNLEKLSKELTPLVYKEGRLTRAETAAVSKNLESLGVALKLLTKQVQGVDEQPRRLMNVPDSVTARIDALSHSKAASGKAMDVLWGSAERRESVLHRDLGRPMLGRFLEDVQHAVHGFALETGDPALMARAEALFADPLVAAVQARLGTQQSPHGEYAVLMDSGRFAPRDTNEAGVRFKNIPLRADTAMQLPDGSRYFAHPMTTPDGRQVGIATAYPRTRDMPEFLQVLAESKTSRIWVLASRDEIANPRKAMPGYFLKGGTWGAHRVSVEALPGTKHYGPLEVREHRMTIQGPGQPPKVVTVSHFTNWPDKTTVPHEALLAFTADQAKVADPRGPLVHCWAGVGRTGTVLTAEALTHNPALRAEDVVQGFREIRSPVMVQTPDQLATTVRMQREMEASGRAAGDGLVYEDVRADWQRQSRLDPRDPADDDPIYANLPSPRVVANAEPVYENLPRR